MLQVTPEYNRAVLDKVDTLVRTKFWSTRRFGAWTETVKNLRPKIVAAKDIIELDTRINEALQCLDSSHTQFLTINDETFYLLHCLFARDDKSRSDLGDEKIEARLFDFTGITTSGTTHIVRYVLDHSPAFHAGVKRGDELQRVDGKPFLGQISFLGTSGKQLELTLNRNGNLLDVCIVPERADLYKSYVQAIKDSVRVFRSGSHVIGYIHFWIGDTPAHEILESALAHQLALSDGLIFDLRDGYGAAWVDDLDYFYRPETAYPKDMRYSKPVVALINSGTRSGKEALAYSLKRSGRAKLVGERTAGAFLSARLFKLDDRTALYLPLHDADFLGQRLEGVGVSPDVEQANADGGDGDRQYDQALSILQQNLDGSEK